jgi:hypothetical protein
MVRELVRAVARNAAAVVELLILVGGAPEALSNELWSAVMDQLEDRAAGSLSGLVAVPPESWVRLATSAPVEPLARLADRIEDTKGVAQGEVAARTVRAAMVLVHHRSRNLGRLAQRVIGRIPEFVERLAVFEGLRSLARDLAAASAHADGPAARVDVALDAFDVAALRAALMALLLGTDLDAEYTAAFDAMIAQSLLACAQRLGPPAGLDVARFEGLALYATGGMGRSEAFAADWDYLAVVDAADPEVQRCWSRALQRLEGALSRRGWVPHNRITQRFDAYAAPLGELERSLTPRSPETFIDEAEILEARLMAGDERVDRGFMTRLVAPLEGAEPFILDALRELVALRGDAPAELSVKHGAGGLREIQLLSLVIRAYARLGGPFDPSTLARAAEALPGRRADLRFLLVAKAELRRVRDLHRLLVAPGDAIDPKALTAAAAHLRPLRDAGVGPKLELEVHKLMEATASRIDRISKVILRALTRRSVLPEVSRP